MTNSMWFSAKLRYAIFIGENDASKMNDVVYLLKASDFAGAFSKSLHIGYKNEEKYKNIDGDIVYWKFIEIISIDIILGNDLDCAEVYSEPIHLSGRNKINFHAEIHPEHSKPIQTI